MAAAAAMAAESLDHVRLHPECLDRLRKNVAYLKRGWRDLGIDMADTPSPIFALRMDTGTRAAALQAALFADGVFTYHGNYVGADRSGGLRCAVFADHNQEHLDLLIALLRKYL